MSAALATSSARLEACLPYIFEGEGGYSAVRSDPGNWTGNKVGKGTLKGTKYGIAAGSFPNLDIKNITRAQAADIYRQRYWHTAGCDELPAGPDLPIFDVSVNSGPGRGTSFRKATENVRPDTARIKAISAKRRAFYQGLSTFKTFGKGWMNRVAKIEAAALKMALRATGASPVIVQKTLLTEADASTKKVQTGSVVGGSTVTGASGAMVAAGTGPGIGIDWWQIGLGVAVVAVALAITVHFVRAHYERAEALRDEAKVA